MNDFVPKPFDVDHLITTVLRLTGRLPQTASTAETASAIDVERGHFNWSDSTDYHKYLRRFAATHGSDADKIARLLTQGRREDAAALVHGLKGVAGIMALTTVWRDADSLERALAQGKDSGVQVCDLQQALQVALSAIRGRYGTGKDSNR